MPHDPAYKKLFSQPRLIEDLLKGFVPQPWVAELDFDTLEKLNVHFVTTPKLGWRQSDLIWRVKRRGDWLYILLLLEFQSSIDRWMPLRLWVYLGLLYLELLEQNQLLPSGKLPPVLPVVLYNGTPRWQATTELADLLETLPGLSHYQPRFQFLLLDEGRYAESDLRLPQNIVAALFRFEHSREPADILRILQDLIPTIQQQPELDTAILAWLKTLLVRVKFPEEHLNTIDRLYEVNSMLLERMQSWTERWKQEGLMQGIAEGMEKGIKRGYLAGERETYVRLARLRFDLEIANQLVPLLEQIQDRQQLAQVGEWLIQCESGAELLSRIERLVNDST